MSTYYLTTESYSVSNNSGTKVFVDLEVSHGTSVNLPVLGEAFSLEYPDLVAETITKTLNNRNASCGYKYTVNYVPKFKFNSGVDLDKLNDLPISMTMGAIVNSVPAKSRWYWSNGNQCDTNIVIPKREFIGTITVQRSVYDTNLETYSVLMTSIMGKVNSTSFRGFSAGVVMFVGCQAGEVFSDSSTKRKWVISLNFDLKGSGWNKLYNTEENEYDEVKFDGLTPMFPSDTFATLFSTSKDK